MLYTDNYYTSIKLAKHMYEKYGWTIVGTIVPTDKKHREADDFPFLKLSNGARDSVGRGWFREAALKLQTPSGSTYYIQATTWRDKKQVCFVSNCTVGFSNGISVKRHVRGKRDREIIDGVRAQAEYVKYFNAVDRNDRDSADYSTSIRTNRYYLRIFCWSLDRVIHCAYNILCFMVMRELGNPDWKKYLNKNEGRRDFQIDLAIEIMNYGLSLDWDGGDDRPSYMRKDIFVPCNCKKCFFCQCGATGVVSGVPREGVKRKAVFHFQCGARKVSKRCTEERVRLTNKDGAPMAGTYCRMCVRNDKRDVTHRVKQKDAKKSTMGCNQCREPICKVCWAMGYDKHPAAKKKKSR